MSDQTPERFADQARRYRLDSRIATGGMGEVWRGTDTALGRPVAVKLLKSEYADDPTFRTRFESEARHAASLHHPNVAAVYDVGESAATDGSGQPVPFLVMELVDGQPLSVLLRGGRRLDATVMRDLLAQAADGIGAAHRAGIVHRDVKPANLMVTPDRVIKITDFGIARATDGLGLTGTGQVMGTPQYLSPEQARGNPATTASDVYSLGVVAWECLAGHRPFEKESAVATALAHLNDPVPALPDSVPADLASVVERALAKDPARRYPDGDALAVALRDPATAATQVVGAPLPPLTPRNTPAYGDATAVMPAAGAPDPAPRTPAQPVVQPGTSSLSRPVEPEPDRLSPWWIVLGMAALAVIAVLLVLRFTGDDGTDGTDDTATPTTPSSTPSESPSESASEDPTPSESASEESTFDLDGGAYIGEDADGVARELERMGLIVKTQEVDNDGDQEAGTVESVTPTRDLSKGDTVVLRVYGEAPEPTPSPTPTPTPTSTPSATPSSTPSGAPSSPAAEAPSGTPASPSGGSA